MRDGARDTSDEERDESDDGRDGRHGAIARPTVVLLHTLPDGSHHFDWMIARDDTDSGPLQTWRCPRRVDAMGIGESIMLTPLPDHRRAYLRKEGPLDPKNGIDRGHVKRVQSGTWNDAEPEGTGVVRWGDGKPQALAFQSNDEGIRVTRLA